MAKIYLKKSDICYPEECSLIFDGKNFKLHKLDTTIYFDGEVVEQDKNGKYYICRTQR